jgi:hypothetical protein
LPEFDVAFGNPGVCLTYLIYHLPTVFLHTAVVQSKLLFLSSVVPHLHLVVVAPLDTTSSLPTCRALGPCLFWTLPPVMIWTFLVVVVLAAALLCFWCLNHLLLVLLHQQLSSEQLSICHPPHTGFFFEMLRRNYVFEVSSLDQNDMKTHLL